MSAALLGRKEVAFMGDNIILIGMPGSGKSTLGKALAQRRQMLFVDTDRVIEQRMGASLAQLLERYGDDGFREIENQINATLEARHSVIAPGGSVVYGEQAMRHLKEMGTVVYLRLSCAQLARRLGDLHARGVTIRPGWTLRDLYNERCPLYARWADVTLDCDGLRPAQSLNLLQDLLDRRTK